MLPVRRRQSVHACAETAGVRGPTQNRAQVPAVEHAGEQTVITGEAAGAAKATGQVLDLGPARGPGRCADVLVHQGFLAGYGEVFRPGRGALPEPSLGGAACN